MRKTFLISGTFLLLLGLLPGTVLDRFASPDIASDAHVAGVQHGILLMVIGLAWRFTDLAKLGAACASLKLVGLYGIWLAFLLGAAFGEPYPSTSATTYFIFVVSSWALIIGVAFFLYGLLCYKDV